MSEFLPYLSETMNCIFLWRTSVSGSYQDEYREGLDENPVLRFNMSIFAYRDQAQHIIAICQNSGGELRVPDWRLTFVGSYDGGITWPAGLHYLETGDSVAVYTNEGVEEVTATVTGDVVVLSKDFSGKRIAVAPVLTMKLAGDPSVQMEGGIAGYVELTVIRENYSGFTAATKGSFAGYPFITNRSLLDNFQSGLLTNLNSRASDAGVVSLFRTRIRDQVEGTYSFNVETLEEYIEFEKELFAFEGRLSPFWAPSWQSDFVLRADPGFTADELSVRARPSVIADRLEAIAIEGTDYELSYHLVDSVVSDENGMIIKLQSPILNPIYKSDPRLCISKATLMRLDSDEITVRVGSRNFQCSVATVEVFR